ncbi:hypothetical protein ACAX43_09670 [Paraburkholderia sp. IW21]|uniref:hypothetical protein n=1 Tax=Paraburkholderia sp. IW21 TaxID=3242488 RepID=UPI003520442B
MPIYEAINHKLIKHRNGAKSGSNASHLESQDNDLPPGVSGYRSHVSIDLADESEDEDYFEGFHQFEAINLPVIERHDLQRTPEVMMLRSEHSHHERSLTRSGSPFDPLERVATESSDDDEFADAAEEVGPPVVRYEALADCLVTLACRIQQETVAGLMSGLSVEQRVLSTQYRFARKLNAELSAVYEDANLSLLQRFTEMAKIISCYEEWVPENIRSLQQGLKLTSKVERLLDIAQGEYGETNVRGVIAEIRGVLNSGAVQSALSRERSEQFLTILDRSAQTFEFLAKLNSLEDGAGFSDYLELVASDQLINELAPESLTSLVSLAADVKKRIELLYAGVGNPCADFPTNGTHTEKLGWLVQILEVDEVRQALSPFLGPQWLALLTTPQAVVKLLGDYPDEAGSLEKLRWIASLESSPSARKITEGTLLRPVVEGMSRAVGGSDQTLPIIDFLTRLTAQDVSRFEQARMLASALLGPVKTRNMVSLLAPFSPAAKVGAGVYDWYMNIPVGMTWRETAQYFVDEAAHYVRDKPALITSITGVDITYALSVAEIIRKLPAIKRDWSWEETAAWLVQETIRNPHARWYFDRFLEVCLAWQFYQILTRQDAIEDPEALQGVVKILQCYLPDGGEVVIDALLTVWPLLPGLIALREELGTLPPTDSWITWLNVVVERSRQSSHPAIEGLAARIEALACRLGTHAMLSVSGTLSSAMASVLGTLRSPGLRVTPRGEERPRTDNAPTGGALDAIDAATARRTQATVALARYLAQPLASLQDVISDYVDALAVFAFKKMPPNSEELGVTFACLMVLEALDRGGNIPDETTSSAANTVRPDELAAAAPSGLSSIPDTRPVIWGDEQAKREKILAGLSLAAYWLATTWAAYKVLSPRFGSVENEAPDAAMDAGLIEVKIDGSTDRKADAKVGEDIPEAAQKLVDNAADDHEPPSTGGARHFLKKYRGELAVGAAVMMGAGLTAYFVEKYFLCDDLDAAIDRILGKLEFIDVTSIPEFQDLLSGGHARQSRRVLSEGALESSEEKIKEYLLALSGRLGKEGPLKIFFENLTARLLPHILSKQGVVGRLGDDFALLAELDLMLMKMQRYIVSVIIAFDNFTDFRMLLMLNQLRNFILQVLLDKYNDRTLSYYAALVSQREFQELNEFWKIKIPGSYLRYLLHGEGLSDKEIEFYCNLLKTTLEAAMLSDSVSTRDGAVGFIGEDGVIKLIIEGVEGTFKYYDGKLLWDEARSAEEKDDAEKSVDAELIDRITKVAGYLERASKALSKPGARDFTYPGSEKDCKDSVFIKGRIREIVGPGNEIDQIIAVTYACENEKRVALFSIEQIVMGLHLKHANYKNRNAEIKWPVALGDELKGKILAISNEMSEAKKIVANADRIRAYQATLKGVKIGGIVKYVDNAIRREAAKLGITGDVNIDTRVVVSTTEMKPAPISQMFPSKHIFTVENEYRLGEISLRKLNSTRDMKVSDARLGPVVERLLARDFQSEYQGEVSSLMEMKQIKEAFDAVMVSKIKPLLDQPGRLHWIKYSGFELAGLLMYRNENDRINILSLLDDSLKEFLSLKDVEEKFKLDKELAHWMLGHSVDTSAAWIYDKFGRYPTGAVIPISFDEDAKLSSRLTYHQIDSSSFSFYQNFLTRLYREADLLAKSRSEIDWQTALDWLEVFAIAAAIFSLPLGPLAGFVIGLVTEAGPAIGRAIIEDDPEEQDSYLWDAAISLMSEAALTGAPYGLSGITKKIRSSPSYRKLISWMASENSGKSTNILRNRARGESGSLSSLEWNRKLDHEARVRVNANIEKSMSCVGGVLRDARFRGKTSLETAAELDNMKTSGKLLPDLNRDQSFSIKFRSINQWDRLHPDSRIDHLVTVIDLDNVKYVIDPTPISMESVKGSGQTVMLEQEWFRRHQEGTKSKLVKYKDFYSLKKAKKYNDRTFVFDVDKTESGTVVLSSPAWYEPDLGNYGGLNANWRANVSLEGVTPDSAGIYRIPQPGTSTSLPVECYIRNQDGGVFRVKWDDDARTWRVINPSNTSGYAPPVRRSGNGAWVRHLDLAGKGGAPVRARQTLLTGQPLSQMTQFMKNGQRGALEHLDVAQAALKNGLDSEMVATIAECLWGRQWLDKFARPQLIEKLASNLEIIRKRVRKFDPAAHVSYYNTKASAGPEGPAASSSTTVAELDQWKYQDVVQDKEPGTYVNAYETGVNFIKSRDDLGKAYMGRVIVHEMTHATGKTGELSTVDNAYIGILRADKKHDLTALARLPLDPGAAANNADSYATFVQYVTQFKRNPEKFTEFKAAFGKWKADRVQNAEAALLFDFNVPQTPAVGRVIQRNLQDMALNVAWRRADDQGKVNLLIQRSAKLPEFIELAYLVGGDVLERSVGKSLRFDFDGVEKTRFSWGATHDVDLEKLRVRIANDLLRYKEAQAHLKSLQKNPLKLTRQLEEGASVDEAAAEWILGANRSDRRAVGDMVNTLQKFKSADLFDKSVIESIHHDVYRPAAGEVPRHFRTADDPTFMSLDIADEFLRRRLNDISTVSAGGGDLLFAAMARGRPYGDGNIRTARTLYALHELRSNPSAFRRLTAEDEDLLSGLAILAPAKPAGGAPPALPPSGPRPATPNPSTIRVEVEVVGALRSAAQREYKILDLGSDVEVGIAETGKKSRHMTVWRAGEKPLDNPPDDIIVSAGELDTTRLGVSSGGTPDSNVMTLLFYRPGTYRIVDRNLAFLMRSTSRFGTEGDDSGGVAGFKSSEFQLSPSGTWTHPIGASSQSVLDYAGGQEKNTPTGAALSKVSEYTVTHYEYDDLEIQKMALIPGRAGAEVQGADILSIAVDSPTGARMSIDEVRRQVADVGPNYKRVHLCVCRPLGEAATLTMDQSRNPSVADQLRLSESESESESDVTVTPGREAASGTRVPITHLVTLITLDNVRGTAEETVQGVIAKHNGEYIEIDPAVGDKLSLPGYEVKEWHASTPWGDLSEDVINAAKL